MTPDSEKACFKALVALQNRDYATASSYFKTAQNLVAKNADLRILSEATEILLAVKDELRELEMVKES